MTYDEQTIQSACVKLAEMLICDDEVLNADSRAFEEHAKALASWFRIEAEHYIRVTKDTEAFALGTTSNYEGLRILEDGRVVCNGSDGLPVVICDMSPAEAELIIARSAVLVGGAGTTASSDTPEAPLKSDELLAVERLQPAQTPPTTEPSPLGKVLNAAADGQQAVSDYVTQITKGVD